MTAKSGLRLLSALALLALLATGALAMPSGPATADTETISDRPYMGWSSWSLQATEYPGTNPDGPGSWLTEANVLAQADAMAKKLKPYGYEYINVDAGWQDGVDEYGRPVVNTKRFPNGIQPVADYVHERGLKFGLYAVVGLGMDAYNDGNTPIYGTDNCFTRDIVYPDLRTTNGWDSAYKIDFSDPCAQAYVDSFVDKLASWDIDFLKLDGVGPGSFKGGPNYDNTSDVEAWSKALRSSGRDIEFIVSWALSHRQAETWKQFTNGWRIDTDVECYCETLVKWDQSVKQRWNDVVQWIDDAGPGRWNNLDTLNVGVGEMDGLTKAERRSYATFWAIEAAPLYVGDDLTKLDPYGLSLLTNEEVIAINQNGKPARPLSQATPQQVWYTKYDDGSYVVGLFNLDAEPATVTARWNELGITGPATVRDVWQRGDIGTEDKAFRAKLPSHGTRLLRITPLDPHANSPSMPSRVHATAASESTVSLAWDASTSMDSAGQISYQVYANGKQVALTSDTEATIEGLDPSTSFAFTVRAIDDSGQLSARSKPAPLTTPAAAGPATYEAEAAANTLGGSAVVSDCSGCSGGKKVGYLGDSGTLTFNDIEVPVAGTYVMTVDYVAGDASRQGEFTVNGGASSFSVNFQGSNDNDWNTSQRHTVAVQLEAGANTIQIANPTGYVADIDAITL